MENNLGWAEEREVVLWFFWLLAELASSYVSQITWPLWVYFSFVKSLEFLGNLSALYLIMRYLLRNKHVLDVFVINGRHAFVLNLDFYPSIKSSYYSI